MKTVFPVPNCLGLPKTGVSALTPGKFQGNWAHWSVSADFRELNGVLEPSLWQQIAGAFLKLNEHVVLMIKGNKKHRHYWRFIPNGLMNAEPAVTRTVFLVLFCFSQQWWWVCVRWLAGESVRYYRADYCDMPHPREQGQPFERTLTLSPRLHALWLL